MKLPTRVTRGVIAIALLCLAISAFSAMVADIIAHQSVRAERRWLTQETIDPQEWRSARANLQTALALSSNHPDYLQSLGRLYYLQIFFSDDSAMEPPENGLTYYRDSLKVRPYWPYAWAEFALLKSITGQLDAEFDNATRYAEAFGPWEKQALVNLLLTYFGVWPQLTSEQQERAIQLLLRVRDYDSEVPQLGLRVALNTEASSILCEHHQEYLKQYKVDANCTELNPPQDSAGN